MECRECSSGVSPSLRLPECTDWFAGISDLMSIIAHRQSDLLPRLEVLRQQWSRFWDEAIPNDLLVVRATNTGVVISLSVATGDRIVTRTNLVGLAKFDSLKVQVPVSVSLIDSLHLDRRAIVRLGAEIAAAD